MLAKVVSRLTPFGALLGIIAISCVMFGLVGALHQLVIAGLIIAAIAVLVIWINPHRRQRHRNDDPT